MLCKMQKPPRSTVSTLHPRSHSVSFQSCKPAAAVLMSCVAIDRVLPQSLIGSLQCGRNNPGLGIERIKHGCLSNTQATRVMPFDCRPADLETSNLLYRQGPSRGLMLLSVRLQDLPSASRCFKVRETSCLRQQPASRHTLGLLPHPAFAPRPVCCDTAPSQWVCSLMC